MKQSWAVGILVLIVVVAIVAAFLLYPPQYSFRPSTPSFSIEDESQALNGTFHPGLILGASSNNTAALLGGIGVYAKPDDLSLPALASAVHAPKGLVIHNLTSLISNYFWQGGIYSIVWNGSAWLFAGQASWGGMNSGAAVAWNSGHFSNLTGALYGATSGGGAWAAAWNGTSWLIGGNSTWGPVLLSMQGDNVTNLTSHIQWHDTRSWVQFLSWNGHEWLIAGEGILGLLSGTEFIDMFPSSPYANTGAYFGGWDGSVWLVGGGSGRLVEIQGTTVLPGPSMPSHFDQAILLVAPFAGGWIIGGKGTSAVGDFAPELVFSSSATSVSKVVDLSSLLPASFSGGEIYGGTTSPGANTSFYLVGEGAYNETSGYAVGAIAMLACKATACGSVGLAQWNASQTAMWIWSGVAGRVFFPALAFLLQTYSCHPFSR